MPSKRQLVNGVSVKVENRSGFDKSRFNALTTKVGAITPLVKQLVIPNSDGSCRVKISAQLPPLATDAFLRSHLKIESFYAPLRLAYGGFESWICGREVYDTVADAWKRAKLPNLGLAAYEDENGYFISDSLSDIEADALMRGPGTLCDYLGISSYSTSEPNSGAIPPGSNVMSHESIVYGPDNSSEIEVSYFNIFPFVLYGLIYDEYYRNKLIERPLFSPPSARFNQSGETDATDLRLYNLPYISIAEGEMTYVDVLTKRIAPNGADDDFVFSQGFGIGTEIGGFGSIDLLNGDLLELRQRNYGDDYFTAATPSAQEGDPITVSIVDGKFSIASLRMQNALQEFAEVNNFASPDYIQTLSARYGASLSAGVAQKPIYLGSADIPMYSSGVEQTANDVAASQDTNTPFKSVGARYGRAHAEATELVCKFHADEPGYFFVFVTLVPEAQYYQGVDRDMMIFNAPGSLVDLPCGLLEHVGNEPILQAELNSAANTPGGVFGYVQRYLWHKLGHQNEVHGLFKGSQNLGSFVVQRKLGATPTISRDFLKIKPSDLDNVAAVSGDISKYGVFIDSAIDLFVSEPLSESALPALSNPAREHGRSVYIKTGGSKLA